MRVIILSLVLDAILGDPPNRWHPTAWMGSLIAAMRKNAPENGRFAFGGLIALGGGIVVWSIGKLLTSIITKLPAPMNIVCEAAILNFTLSLNGLTGAAGEVRAALEDGNLSEARRLVSWHLVSRDTTSLNASQLSGATIQSVAENFSDSVIAPLFFYGMGGLPAALAYRYLNTCDAMLGYRDAEREWLGKIPARLDDVANLVPARLSAVAILVTAPLHMSSDKAIETYRRDAETTPSPNGGHPMSATAGVLQVRLLKIGTYDLGRFFRQPDPYDIGRANNIVRLATIITLPVFWIVGKLTGAKKD